MSLFCHLFVFLTVFLIFHPTACTDILAPFLSPISDKLCKDLLCGKGKCKISVNGSFGYMCECDLGWKQTISDDNKHLQFLPCVIPNCTLNYSCTKAETPSPQVQDPPKNDSILDPCNWAYCGEGSCVKSSSFGHKCDCREGYTNLLNSTAFPCFSECSLGTNCNNLGLTSSNKSADPLHTSGNHVSSELPGKFVWMVALTLTIVMNTWK